MRWLWLLGVLLLLAGVAVIFLSPPSGYAVDAELIPDYCTRFSELPPQALGEGEISFAYDTFVILNGEEYYCRDYGWLDSAKPATR